MKVPTLTCVDPAALAARSGGDVEWLVAILVTALTVLFIGVAHFEARHRRARRAALERLGEAIVTRAVRPD